MTELSSWDPLLIVRPSILNMITLSIVSWSPKQNSYLYLCLDLHRVLFLCFFFSKLSTWSSSHVAISSFPMINIIIGVPPCFTTWIRPPFLIYTLRSKVSPRFHQLSKTKLGLSPVLSLRSSHPRLAQGPSVVVLLQKVQQVVSSVDPLA